MSHIFRSNFWSHCIVASNWIKKRTWLWFINLYDKIIIFLFKHFCAKQEWIENLGRNEKHKYFNKEKLALGEKENTSALVNIAQEDDSNIFKLFKNLWLNNLQFIILKCSRFCLFIAFDFILLLLYTQIFLILYF